MRTLLHHTAIYLVARGVPGLINFLAIVVYTRMLPPNEYGRYALVLAGVGFAQVVLFQWIALSVLRFLPAYHRDPAELLNTVKTSYLLLVGTTLLLGGIAMLAVPNTWRGFVPLALIMLWAQAWFEINLELARAKLQPIRYGLSAGLRAVTALLVGTLLIGWLMDAVAPLMGHVVGFILGTAILARKEWHGARTALVGPVLKQLMLYGMPLSATLALSFIVSSSDRFLIAYYLDESSAGLYAAGYDLASQVLILCMMVVNMAAYPLAVTGLEQKGLEEARVQLSRNILLLLAVAVPVTVTIMLFAPLLAKVVLGQRFHMAATPIIPWIALATLLAGLRAYYFDLAFQLGKRTIGQLGIIAIAAVVNVGLNIVWIPIWGMIGAARATLTAYTVALICSALMGRRVFPLPMNWKGLLRVSLSAFAMVAVGFLVPQSRNLWGELAQITGVLLTYSGVLAILYIPLWHKVIRNRMGTAPVTSSNAHG